MDLVMLEEADYKATRDTWGSLSHEIETKGVKLYEA